MRRPSQPTEEFKPGWSASLSGRHAERLQSAEPYLRGLHEEQSHDDTQLQQDEQEGDDELGAGRHEARLLGADLLLAAGQDPRDAVGLQKAHMR